MARFHSHSKTFIINTLHWSLIVPVRLTSLAFDVLLPWPVLSHGTTSQGDSMKKQKGFSLIELLIVVAIILIIAAIAIPNLLRSRMAANESSAVGSIRTMNTAAISYNSTYQNGFPSLITQIGTTGTAAVSCDNAELIDSVLTSKVKSG